MANKIIKFSVSACGGPPEVTLPALRATPGGEETDQESERDDETEARVAHVVVRGGALWEAGGGGRGVCGTKGVS